MDIVGAFREKLKMRPNPFITTFMMRKLEEAQDENEKLAELVEAEEKINKELEEAIRDIQELNKRLEEKQ